MEFDKSKVFTALNAEELKIGSKVILADSLSYLKECLGYSDDIVSLVAIRNEKCTNRFFDGNDSYNLAYLVKEPSKLKRTDLKIGDIIRKKYEDGYRYATVIRIDTYSATDKHIGLGGEWLSDEELALWEKVEE